MFDLLLSLNIKQYKKIGESGLISYGNDWKALCSSLPLGALPNLVTRLLLTFVSNLEKTEQ